MAIKTSQSFSKFLACFLIFLLVFQSVGYVYGVSIVCLQSSEAIYPPYFDSATGYCVTYPINENGDCPTGYIFNTALNKCVSFPACDDPNYVYDLSSKSCVPIGSVSVGGEGEYLDPDKPYCGVDLNGDGELSRDEIAECITTDQGLICPLDWVECGISCPEGSTYNPATEKCEAEPQCSEGTYDPSLKKCVTSSQIASPSITFISGSSSCASPFVEGMNLYMPNYCGSGWGSTTTAIIRVTGSGEVVFYSYFRIYGSYTSPCSNYLHGRACFDDDHWVCMSLSTGQRCCISGGDYDPFHKSQCSVTIPAMSNQEITVTVTSGGGHKTSTACREAIVSFSNLQSAYSCPSGFTYSNGQCVGNPICPAGTTFNTSTGKCESVPGHTCPSGDPCQYVSSQGKWLCSPTQCSSVNDVEDEEPDLDPTGLIDDGERAEDGTCLGTIYIFNGFKMRCRKAGVQTGFQNCCDEAQGRVYDSTGSFDTFTSIKNAITAIMFSKRIVEMGYYAEKVAKGVYTLEEAGDLLKIKDSAGNIIKTFQKNVLVGTKTLSTPEYVALKDIQQGMDTTTAIKQATTGYVEQYTDVYGGDVALAVINLAMGQLIDDPVLQATVNLATTVVLASGVFNNVGLALSNPTLTIAMGVIQLGLALFMGGCDSQDVITSTLNKSGRCHYVGDRCVKKWFGKCVQKIKVYCCFNSKLARIIHEQGRPQLSTFGASGGWGSAKHPNCRGFTPEEFQAIDFGRIDLSEYYGDIQRNIRQTIETDVNTQIEDTYQGLQEGVRPNE